VAESCTICNQPANQITNVKLFLFAADDEFGEKSVSVLLDGEESEMTFIDHPSVEMSVSITRSK
jgi:hypothetical protein